ncbi:ABC transporter permease [Microvirga zambiensis]|uniref:ABC transporter permease n=1 Tax=Microvirga zambiensis TaxID=1402137 RepID=UPI00191E8D88|nr:ABC transporter permease [Microvirga zambiensis]
MLAFIAKRVLSLIPVIVVVAIVVFMLLRLSPGDPAVVIAGDNADAAAIERIRVSLGLDQPLVTQFFIWAGSLLQGDLGISIFSKIPVTDLILQRLEPTVSLALTTLFFAVVIAVPLGTIAGATAGSWLDRSLMLVSVLGFSIPAFVLGYCLIYVFSLQLRILPVQGFSSIRQGIGPFLSTIALPTMTMGLAYLVLIARITRASVLEMMGEDFIRTARAKGVKERIVVTRHALRNSAIPILTVIGIGVALLISGVVVIETVFNIPGVGRLVVDAILKRDYPVIQGIILMFSGTYVLINLAIDIGYAFLDPRVRY